jgi:apolipoprotein N-acyltransferase
LIEVVNSLLAAAISADDGTASRRGPAIALLIVVALLAYGARAPDFSPDEEGHAPMEVAIVQGALASTPTDGGESAQRAWTTYASLTESLIGSAQGPAHPDVIVWPETTLAVHLRDDPWHRGHVERLAARARCPAPPARVAK